VAPPRPVLVVSGRHRPHEMLLLAFSVLIGAAYTLGSPPPQSVVAQVYPALVHLWSAGLLVSGLLGLGALLAPLRLDVTLALEAGAMLIGAAALVIAAAAIFEYNGAAKGLFGGGFCIAWMLANVARAALAWRDRRELT